MIHSITEKIMGYRFYIIQYALNILEIKTDMKQLFISQDNDYERKRI